MALKTYWRQLALVFSAQIWHLFLWNGDCSLKIKMHIFLGSGDHEWEVQTVWAWRFSKLKPWAQLKKDQLFSTNSNARPSPPSSPHWTYWPSSKPFCCERVTWHQWGVPPGVCLGCWKRQGKRELGNWVRVGSHPGLRQDLETKFAVIFHNYGLELTQVQDQYEKYKTGTKTQNLWRTKNLQRNAGCGHVPDKIHQRKVLASQEKFRCQAHRWCETFLQLLDTSLGLDTSTGPSESWKLGSMVNSFALFLCEFNNPLDLDGKMATLPQYAGESKGQCRGSKRTRPFWCLDCLDCLGSRFLTQSVF